MRRAGTRCAIIGSMKQPPSQHVRITGSPSRHPWRLAVAALCVAVLAAAGGWLAWPSVWGARAARRPPDPASARPGSASSSPAGGAHAPLTLDRDAVPEASARLVRLEQARRRAETAVNGMSVEERVGQLVMAPLFAGSDASALSDLIANRHVGSVLIIGNWVDGTAGVRQATDALQGYAPADNRLIMATDQEGGLVQHLTGAGFDAMPSAVEQGRMSADQLRASAAVWGAQLAQAGINVDLAPVLDTVTMDRASNAPIGALNRDFGLDAAGNAGHGTAFIEGLRQAGVGAAVKHYPGLGAVSGNTDFTADGILDTTTTLGGGEAGAFEQAIDAADPVMVMMSLATYQAIDPSAPAAFSSAIIDGHLRGEAGYDGVVTSDSLSAAALGGIAPDQLGVRLVEAGGDLACIGDTAYVQPVLDGLLARARSDADFAAKVTRSATRVMTLKYLMDLAG